MKRNRVEAFSDGVIAIIITVMVLEMKVPQGARSFVDLMPVWPSFLAYVLSFLYVAIYWNNHHHLLHAAHKVSAGVMWANMHLLFWLSLVPFATSWLGESRFAANPTALYGVILLMAAGAYFILQLAIIAANGKDSILAKALGSDIKGKLSLLLNAAAIVLTLWSVVLANLIFWIVAVIWLIPDRRIERTLTTIE